MATVLTVPGLWMDIPDNWLGGELWNEASGNTRVRVRYNNWFASNDNAADGVAKLDEAMLAQTPPFIVLGHSMGSQVIYKWIRERGPTSSLTPDDVWFICTGNPERKYNGHPPDGGKYPGGPDGTGLPDDMPWILWDVAAQYDGWCDAPNDPNNTRANSNASYGRSLGGPHSDYGSKGTYTPVSLYNEDNLTYVEGNVTYVLAPTYPLPYVKRWYVLSKTIAEKDALYREGIEEAYSRPYTPTSEPGVPLLEPEPGPQYPIPIPPKDPDVPTATARAVVDRRIHHPRHTLFTLSATAQPWWFMYQADVGRQVNNYWDWHPVEYPAFFPAEWSVATGVKNLTAAIRATPGKFALCGYSQGAIVSSRVYDELRYGSMQDRRDDLIAACMFGNPRREGGHTFPGGIEPGGQGMDPLRLVNTEEFWWEFANGWEIPGSLGEDIFATCPYGEVGNNLTSVYQFFFNVWDGDETDLIGRVLDFLQDPIDGIIDIIAALLFALQTLGVGHSWYEFSRPKLGSDLTAVELAIEYLNQVGADNATKYFGG